jgi:nitrate reductase NapAB chaperone NapD
MDRDIQLSSKHLKARYEKIHHTKANLWSLAPCRIELDHLYTDLVLVMKDNELSMEHL